MKGFLRIKTKDGLTIKIYKEDVVSWSTSELEFEKSLENKTIKGVIELSKEFGFKEVLELMKKDQDTAKFPFKAAVAAVRDGSHQIEKDCDNLDLLRDVLKEAFPEDSDEPKDKYFKIWNEVNVRKFCSKNLPFINLQIIKLSEIMPKEAKLNPCALCTYETSSKGENALVQLCDYHNNGKAQFSFDVPVAPQVEEKPVELEIGRWYWVDRSGKIWDDYKALVFFQGHGIKTYGFDHSDCFTNNYGALDTFRDPKYKYALASDNAITEALKAEAIKRGLVEGVYCALKSESVTLQRIDKSDIIFSNNTLCGFSSYIEFILFKDGVWAEIIPTITRKEAEEKLNAKIVA